MNGLKVNRLGVVEFAVAILVTLTMGSIVDPGFVDVDIDGVEVVSVESAMTIIRGDSDVTVLIKGLDASLVTSEVITSFVVVGVKRLNGLKNVTPVLGLAVAVVVFLRPVVSLLSISIDGPIPLLPDVMSKSIFGGISDGAGVVSSENRLLTKIKEGDSVVF